MAGDDESDRPAVVQTMAHSSTAPQRIKLRCAFSPDCRTQKIRRECANTMCAPHCRQSGACSVHPPKGHGSIPGPSTPPALTPVVEAFDTPAPSAPAASPVTAAVPLPAPEPANTTAPGKTPAPGNRHAAGGGSSSDPQYKSQLKQAFTPLRLQQQELREQRRREDEETKATTDMTKKEVAVYVWTQNKAECNSFSKQVYSYPNLLMTPDALSRVGLDSQPLRYNPQNGRWIGSMDEAFAVDVSRHRFVMLKSKAVTEEPPDFKMVLNSVLDTEQDGPHFHKRQAQERVLVRRASTALVSLASSSPSPDIPQVVAMQSIVSPVPRVTHPSPGAGLQPLPGVGQYQSSSSRNSSPAVPLATGEGELHSDRSSSPFNVPRRDKGKGRAIEPRLSPWSSSDGPASSLYQEDSESAIRSRKRMRSREADDVLPPPTRRPRPDQTDSSAEDLFPLDPALQDTTEARSLGASPGTSSPSERDTNSPPLYGLGLTVGGHAEGASEGVAVPKLWPSDYFAVDVVDVFKACEFAVKQGQSVSETFNAWLPGVRFVKSTFYQHRDRWERAPEHVRLRYENHGRSAAGLWSAFMRECKSLRMPRARQNPN
ncbi:hypothetical protein DENSPDRAFT_885525 [Dentipellis sp. KUC8613]|nr:hypothetical protein DENSPDRAFT_885525 [Dentipellis sp. KUC8613]